MSLSVSYLEKIQESEKLTTIVKQILTILLTAINDWPSQLPTLVDFEKEIYKLVGEEIDKKGLENYVLKIDYSKDAWKGESLSQLIEVYNYYEENKPLKEIFNEIKEKIEEQQGAAKRSTKLLPEAYSRFSRFEYHFSKHAGGFGAAGKDAYYKRALSLLDGPVGGNVQGFTNSAGYWSGSYTRSYDMDFK